MTTYEGSQLANLHRPRQKPALFAENPGPTRGANIRQMSKAPYQHYTYTPDGRYTSSRPYSSQEDRHQSSTTFPSPVHSEKSLASYSTLPLPNYQNHVPTPQRHPTASMPSGFENLLHHHQPTPSPPPIPPPPRRTSSSPRYHLSIRQQPIAARACGAGDRDRRAVDPPPIIQLLLTDFDPSSEEDRSILQDPRFSVGCLLYPVQDNLLKRSRHDTDDRSEVDTNSLLSGKAFVSPFNVDEEPDPSTAPAHPCSSENRMASPRILSQKHGGGGHVLSSKPPASFFVFSDLSVRTAGLYRLQFRLMNWGAVEDIGQSLPVLAEVWSEPFRVYPAKDFPGMRDSSLLTIRLKELGVVELKTRGKGMGKGRRVGDGKGRAE
ncbi:velvet factor-domain-containing protein [Aspergillus unguis]